MTDFEELVKQYHDALQSFINGDAKPMKDTFSHDEEVTLANPFGGIMHGWESVKKALESAATVYSDGTHSFENIMTNVTPDFGYLVEVEKFKAKLGGKAEMSNGSLRVTTIFHKKNGVWKCVHRHADPLVSMQIKESVIKEFEEQKQ